MHYVYVLKSLSTGRHYIGESTNLKSRLEQHRSGSCRTTNRQRPWKLVWFAVFSSRRKALAFEKYLKSGSGYSFSRKRLF
ncbi:MAG: GIY-YIG nuclease family protein [Patescibacteria group bacterium]|nr:GIY-YIG nuclease family protein [Patescibacteria group bacterium]